MAMLTLERPIFEKPTRPMVPHSSEYLEELEAYFDKENEWAAKVRTWKEKCVKIHFLLPKHTHLELRAYLQKEDGRFGLSLVKNDVVKLLIMIHATMDCLKQKDEKEISMLKSASDDDDILGFKKDDLNINQVCTGR